MSYYACKRLNTSYRLILNYMRREGEVVDSRVGRTREIVGFSLLIDDPLQCIVKREGFSRDLMEVEIAMLLAGTFDEELVRAVTPRAADLVGAATAYGPRIVDQLPAVAAELREHSDSRRAVMYVGNAGDLESVRSDDPAVKGEMPCTECIQFLLRDGRLHVCVSMRSWDLVWGLSYDIPMFVSLQMAVARHLGVHPGPYHHYAGSAHVYERHWNLKVDDNAGAAPLDVPCIRPTIAETREQAAKQLTYMRRSRNVKKKVTA